MTGRSRHAFTNDDDMMIVQRWQAGDRTVQIAKTTGHPEGAISKRIQRLREMGYDLPRRHALSELPVAEPVSQALDGWSAFGPNLFANDPRAEAESGFVTKIIPAQSHTSSPIQSSATWAVV